MAKAMHAEQVQKLTDIPNVGKSIAQDLIGLRMRTPKPKPKQVKAMDPVTTFEAVGAQPQEKGRR